MKNLLLLILFSLFIFPFGTHAQVGGLNQNIAIITSPHYPEPNTETTISLDAYTYDTTGASITWYVDGMEETAAKNQRSFDLVTKAVGEVTEIKVVVKFRTGQTLSKTTIINPVRIDMVVEADTLVPTFYRGRALPTTGSIARVIATPHTGKTISPQDLTYSWKHDNKVLFGGPVKGKQVAEIEVGMGLEQIITVEIIDDLGKPIARKSIVLPLSKPEVVFYEENPLRGASRQAIAKTHFMTGDATTLRAEPYYMSADIFSNNPLIEWKIDGHKVTNQSSDPQYLSLERITSNGSSKINFHIRNLKQLLQGVESEFTLRF